MTASLALRLELVITGKGSGEGRVPMTGVPHHAFERYEAQLSQMGYTVRYFDPNNPESIDNPDNEPDSTDGIEPTAPVAPPETDNTKSRESIVSPVPSPVTPPVTDDNPKRKDIEEFEIEIDGTPILVSYNPSWGAGINCHAFKLYMWQTGGRGEGETGRGIDGFGTSRLSPTQPHISLDTVHFEFRSPTEPPQAIPCSETGYHSHFTTAQAVLEYGTSTFERRDALAQSHLFRLDLKNLFSLASTDPPS